MKTLRLMLLVTLISAAVHILDFKVLVAVFCLLWAENINKTILKELAQKEQGND